MRAIIVDDEKLALDLLKRLLERDGRVQLQGAYLKSSEALAELDISRPDLAFLDVDMPQMNGLELAKRIHEKREATEIVFVTAHAQYAIEAFRRDAMDYLLKPPTPEAVTETVSRLFKRRRMAQTLPEPTGTGQLKALLFGGFDLLDTHGQPIRWRTLKTKEMMAYFLAREGQPVSKWDLMTDLWPEFNEEQCRSYLHTTLYKLKKALKGAGGSERIEYVSGQYYADFGNIANPLRMFRALDRAQPPMDDAAAADYREVIGHYRGELFAKLDYPWSYPYREMCFGVFRNACIRLCRHHLDKGEADAAAYAAGQLLAQSEIDEEAHELMLHVHFLKADRIGLKQQFAQLKDTLMSEMGIFPKSAVEALYGRMMDDLGKGGLQP